MKRATTKTQAVVIFGLAMAIMLGMRGPADATWYKIHGHSASVQDEGNPAIVQSIAKKGAGLEIKLQLATSTWIHFAVPTVYSSKRDAISARYVEVRVNLINDFCQCSNISRINVYNGETLVKEFAAGWDTPGWQTITLDLEKKYSFSKGLGISVELFTGPNGGYDSFIFSEAGANFVP